MKRETKLDNLILAIKDAKLFLRMAQEQVSGDIGAEDLSDARSELSNASNAIDDAMGAIDQLMAPEPTREEMHDA